MQALFAVADNFLSITLISAQNRAKNLSTDYFACESLSN
jgi:hypothetical protein